MVLVELVEIVEAEIRPYIQKNVEGGWQMWKLC